MSSEFTDCTDCLERFEAGDPMVVDGVCEPCRQPQYKWACTECGAKKDKLHKTKCSRTLDVLSSECAKEEQA